ncbi:Fis family transcriptional regulator [Saccharomonospora piscinae]|uniref:Fis family transcriptional regulator n=1 Tax=Saccharomonospora piscinae TaxID=687388 RepID=A0A1V8ZYT4_SACPI|nr:helix-turn-helix domain-containing protein [Saccharomonospora piscinae]OQO90042.1 Fis family transcriptional regulator [Saccharomonospora piscinae]TLW90871.1 PucR family transcriptional regulator [Saccharomonospora piscinae]
MTGRAADGAADPSVLPGRLAEIMRPELESVADEIVAEIRALIPEYRRPLDGPYGKTIKAGVQHAVSLFAAQIADPSASKQHAHEVHRRLGQYEMREGRSLDTLQAAYRAGARVAWRRIMEVGRRSGFSSGVMSHLADAMLGFMDELASVALDGFLEAKARSTDALDTWRRRLLQLVLERPAVPPDAIEELAQLVGWTTPKAATPVAVRPLHPLNPAQRPSLDPDVLAELSGVEPRLLLPGPLTRERVAALERALPRCRFAVGPCVPLDAVADSLRWARKALALVDEGVLTPRRVMWVQECLPVLLLHADTALAAQLRRRLLTTLDGLTPRQRERMLETLRAWLDAQGHVLDMAERLSVHPQTVRYRMRQLEATFGDRLREPEARFELELAVRTMPDRIAGPATSRRS